MANNRIWLLCLVAFNGCAYAAERGAEKSEALRDKDSKKNAASAWPGNDAVRERFGLFGHGLVQGAMSAVLRVDPTASFSYTDVEDRSKCLFVVHYDLRKSRSSVVEAATCRNEGINGYALCCVGGEKNEPGKICMAFRDFTVMTVRAAGAGSSGRGWPVDQEIEYSDDR